MRYFDDFGNELKENEIDLSVGYLTTGTVVKVDAEPIDNITKFAWADDDYEEAYFYHLFAEEPTPEEPDSGDSVWDELDAAYKEGVDSV